MRGCKQAECDCTTILSNNEAEISIDNKKLINEVLASFENKIQIALPLETKGRETPTVSISIKEPTVWGMKEVKKVHQITKGTKKAVLFELCMRDYIKKYFDKEATVPEKLVIDMSITTECKKFDGGEARSKDFKQEYRLKYEAEMNPFVNSRGTTESIQLKTDPEFEFEVTHSYIFENKGKTLPDKATDIFIYIPSFVPLKSIRDQSLLVEKDSLFFQPEIKAVDKSKGKSCEIDSDESQKEESLNLIEPTELKCHALKYVIGPLWEPGQKVKIDLTMKITEGDLDKFKKDTGSDKSDFKLRTIGKAGATSVSAETLFDSGSFGFLTSGKLIWPIVASGLFLLLIACVVVYTMYRRKALEKVALNEQLKKQTRETVRKSRVELRKSQANMQRLKKIQTRQSRLENDTGAEADSEPNPS